MRDPMRDRVSRYDADTVMELFQDWLQYQYPQLALKVEQITDDFLDDAESDGDLEG